jgi:hypothetical protein
VAGIDVIDPQQTSKRAEYDSLQSADVIRAGGSWVKLDTNLRNEIVAQMTEMRE